MAADKANVKFIPGEIVRRGTPGAYWYARAISLRSYGRLVPKESLPKESYEALRQRGYDGTVICVERLEPGLSGPKRYGVWGTNELTKVGNGSAGIAEVAKSFDTRIAELRDGATRLGRKKRLVVGRMGRYNAAK